MPLAGFILLVGGFRLLIDVLVCVVILQYRHLLCVSVQVLANHQTHILKLFVVLDFHAASPRELLGLAVRYHAVRQPLDTLLALLGVALDDARQHGTGALFHHVIVLFASAVVEYLWEVQRQLFIYFFF